MHLERDTPQYAVASRFMAHKGYEGIQPSDVTKLDDVPCWYFYYDVPDGMVELEVFWDRRDERWEATVTTFSPGGDATQQLVGR